MKKAKKWIEEQDFLWLSVTETERLIKAYEAGATQETSLLSQHIIDLQKDKGNLTDKVRELEQQIEKMKRCYTCKHHTGLGYCKLKQNNGVCENHDKWEFGD